MARARDSKVDGVYRVRNVEAMVAFVPVARATFDDPDARFWLGWTPLQLRLC